MRIFLADTVAFYIRTCLKLNDKILNVASLTKCEKTKFVADLCKALGNIRERFEVPYMMGLSTVLHIQILHCVLTDAKH